MKGLLKLSVVAILLLIPIASQAKTVDFTFEDEIALNMVRGEIQAPIETTRFQLGGAIGELRVDVDDLKKTRGTIKIDLLNIQSYSFADGEKNSTQTEHMKNWFEIGPDVTKKDRETNRWAVFKIKKITQAEPNKLKDAKAFTDEIGTGRNFTITAEGDLTVHGVTSPKTVELAIAIWEVNPDGTRYKKATKSY